MITKKQLENQQKSITNRMELSKSKYNLSTYTNHKEQIQIEITK